VIFSLRYTHGKSIFLPWIQYTGPVRSRCGRCGRCGVSWHRCNP